MIPFTQNPSSHDLVHHSWQEEDEESTRRVIDDPFSSTTQEERPRTTPTDIAAVQRDGGENCSTKNGGHVRIILVGAMSGDQDDPLLKTPDTSTNMDISMDYSHLQDNSGDQQAGNQSFSMSFDESIASPPNLVRSEVDGVLDFGSDLEEVGCERQGGSKEGLVETDPNSKLLRVSEEDTGDVNAPHIAVATQNNKNSPTPTDVNRTTMTGSKDADAEFDEVDTISPLDIAKLASLTANASSAEEDVGHNAGVSTPLQQRQQVVLATTLSSSPTGSPEKNDTSLEAALMTPVHMRREGSTSEIHNSISWSPSLDVDAVKAASMIPVPKRQMLFTDSISTIFEPSLRDEDGLIAACTTPVNVRRAALCSTPTKTRSTSGSDNGLLAAFVMPVMARKEQFIKHSSSRFKKAQVDDVSLQAASFTSMDSRRAALRIDRDAEPSTPERHLALMASASSSKTRRPTWTTGMGTPDATAAVIRSASTTFDSEEAFQAASSIPVNERRVALARVFAQSSRCSLSLQAELDALKEQLLVSSRPKRKNRRARKDRLFFRLGETKGGMSQKDFSRLGDFVAHDNVMRELKETSAHYRSHEESFDLTITDPVSLRVWLTCPSDKTFEIVTLTLKAGMTVKEVLEGACSLALDPVLSEQQYVSLCNSKNEIVTSTKPVQTLINVTPSKRYQTLLAVPFGSTAALVRAIRKALENTQPMKRWLNEPDPFNATTIERKSSRESQV